jgi:hypothetical protein
MTVIILATTKTAWRLPKVLLVLVAAILTLTGCRATAFSTIHGHAVTQTAATPLRKSSPNKRITPSAAGSLNLHLFNNNSNNNSNLPDSTTKEQKPITSISTPLQETKSKQIATPTSLPSSVSVPTIAALTLSSVILAAKLNLLPGATLPYTNAEIAQDTGMTILTGILGYAFVKANTWAAQNNYLSPKDSRKLIHTFSAPLFMIFWPGFSANEGARFFAASVSFVNMVRLFLAGTGSQGDSSLAFAVSR